MLLFLLGLRLLNQALRAQVQILQLVCLEEVKLAKWCGQQKKDLQHRQTFWRDMYVCKTARAVRKFR